MGETPPITGETSGQTKRTLAMCYPLNPRIDCTQAPTAYA